MNGLYHKEIAYSVAHQGYVMSLDGEPIGIARTFHDADLTLDTVIDELEQGDTARFYPDEWKAITDGGLRRCMEYSTVETPPPPPPPIDDPIELGPGEETDVDGIPQGRALFHMRACPVCASLPRCASCGDRILETGPRVCPVCIEAGEQCCPVCSGPHYGWQCPEIRLARIELAVMDRLPKYALLVA